MSWLNHQWYSEKTALLWKLLIPFEVVYRGIIASRRAAYRLGILKSHGMPVPVIIVGNISVGGVGKTPLTAAIADFLQKNNIRPGIISRGYKGKAKTWPQVVDEKSDPFFVGDEPVLLAKKTGCPVVVSPNRVQAGKKLLEKWDVDVLIADDGLQHYALQRDIEIVVIDAERGFGNGHCLPYGPLRESKNRIKNVDFVVRNEGTSTKVAHLKCRENFSMKFHVGEVFNLHNPSQKKSLSEFPNKLIYAFAGIGNPKHFFEKLRENDLTIIECAFPDHHRFQARDFSNLPPHAEIIMTEKDAVKCGFLKDFMVWVLPIQAELSREFFKSLLAHVVKRSEQNASRFIEKPE